MKLERWKKFKRLYVLCGNENGRNYVCTERPASGEPRGLKEMRYYFNQFGLGVKQASTCRRSRPGCRQTQNSRGLLLDEAIGQFDTYTPLQLAQYVSTIANGGYRLQPRVVKAFTSQKAKTRSGH
ncbi:penicillin-binding transpeptidase domain-containing protein [Bacillus licheniformis]|nr:penicillin-binding transpeptidase domain-containing protein [Bacillus licheniformis]